MTTNNQFHEVIFDKELIAKCQTNAPRYTSYPTADRFTTDFSLNDHHQELKIAFSNSYSVDSHSPHALNHCSLKQSAGSQNQTGFAPQQDEAISLYIHIPFCNTLCLYCACNKIITNDREQIATYIDYLEAEIRLCRLAIGLKNDVRLEVAQLHFGGGSPSWLPIAQLNRLMKILRRYFDFSKAKEIAMEIDPRHVDVDFLEALRENSFNRISIGLQDTNYQVQKAVNRVQSLAHSKFILDKARELGFTSTNVDLIYGLPKQTVASFATTIEEVVGELKPERIALFNYAHLPQIFFSQTRIQTNELPTANVKLDILKLSVQRLISSGYVFIGMDHFALASDELSISLNNGTLQRNFQGYSTHANMSMLALGVSAIGFNQNSYYQNQKELASYYKEIDEQRLPLLRGIRLTQDDRLRRFIINRIMCQFMVNYDEITRLFAIDVADYFATELAMIDDLVALGLVSYVANGFVVTAKGRFVIRNVAVVFDKYFQAAKLAKQHKTVIAINPAVIEKHSSDASGANTDATIKRYSSVI